MIRDWRQLRTFIACLLPAVPAPLGSEDEEKVDEIKHKINWPPIDALTAALLAFSFIILCWPVVEPNGTKKWFCLKWIVPFDFWIKIPICWFCLLEKAKKTRDDKSCCGCVQTKLRRVLIGLERIVSTVLSLVTFVSIAVPDLGRFLLCSVDVDFPPTLSPLFFWTAASMFNRWQLRTNPR